MSVHTENEAGDRLTISPLLRKRDLAALLQCSTRQVEILTAKGDLPQPIRLGTQSPRWRRPEVLQFLGLDSAGRMQQ